jgi:predicted nuclease of predicted toxin-antitoxin system
VKFIVDAHLPPELADFLADRFGVNVRYVRNLGLRDSDDLPIFHAAESTSFPDN